MRKLSAIQLCTTLSSRNFVWKHTHTPYMIMWIYQKPKYSRESQLPPSRPLPHKFSTNILDYGVLCTTRVHAMSVKQILCAPQTTSTRQTNKRRHGVVKLLKLPTDGPKRVPHATSTNANYACQNMVVPNKSHDITTTHEGRTGEHKKKICILNRRRSWSLCRRYMYAFLMNYSFRGKSISKYMFTGSQIASGVNENAKHFRRWNVAQRQFGIVTAWHRRHRSLRNSCELAIRRIYTNWIIKSNKNTHRTHTPCVFVCDFVCCHPGIDHLKLSFIYEISNLSLTLSLSSLSYGGFGGFFLLSWINQHRTDLSHANTVHYLFL